MNRFLSLLSPKGSKWFCSLLYQGTLVSLSGGFFFFFLIRDLIDYESIEWYSQCAKRKKNLKENNFPGKVVLQK